MHVRGRLWGFTLQRLDPDPKSEPDIDRLDTIWTDLEELTPGPLAQWERGVHIHASNTQHQIAHFLQPFWYPNQQPCLNHSNTRNY